MREHKSAADDMNQVELSGTVISRPLPAFIRDGEWYSRFTLQSTRRSNVKDEIPVYIKSEFRLEPGTKIKVRGAMRSYSQHVGGKSRLLVYVMANDVKAGEVHEAPADINIIQISGYVCKVNGLRETPLGRVITEMIVAVNHEDGSSSYLPCITWGSTARMTDQLQPGDKVQLKARFQSRSYAKVMEGKEKVKTAYELSVLEMVV